MTILLLGLFIINLHILESLYIFNTEFGWLPTHDAEMTQNPSTLAQSRLTCHKCHVVHAISRKVNSINHYNMSAKASTLSIQKPIIN